MVLGEPGDRVAERVGQPRLLGDFAKHLCRRLVRFARPHQIEDPEIHRLILQFSLTASSVGNFSTVRLRSAVAGHRPSPSWRRLTSARRGEILAPSPGRGGGGGRAFQDCCAGAGDAVGFRRHALSREREGNERREIMHRPVRFSDDIEPLVQFIEETDPSRILEATLGKLRDGLSVKKLLTASALAVTRSSDLPPGHHGGPLHPLVGLHALHNTVERVSGEQRFLPILQHVALSNKHINHPNMGPYILADAEPVDSGGVEATKKAFFACVDRGLYNGADRHFLWLWDNIPHAEALDLLLTVAIPKNTLDDHYFIFPMFTWRALDWLGREYTPFLMRPAVRYVSRFPMPPVLKDIEPLLEEFELLRRPLGFHTSPEETPAIGELGESISRCDNYQEIPRMLAKALADGLSLTGTGEALSIGAAGLFMRSLTGNPMDVHLHTGANLRPYPLTV